MRWKLPEVVSVMVHAVTLLRDNAKLNEAEALPSRHRRFASLGRSC